MQWLAERQEAKMFCMNHAAHFPPRIACSNLTSVTATAGILQLKLHPADACNEILLE